MEIQISHLDNLNKILLNIRLNMASQISQFPALLCFLSEQTHRAKGRWHGKAPPRAQLARNPDRTAERNDAQLVESGESGEGEESAERCLEFHQSGRGFHRAVHWGRERMPTRFIIADGWAPNTRYGSKLGQKPKIVKICEDVVYWCLYSLPLSKNAAICGAPSILEHVQCAPPVIRCCKYNL